MQQKLGHSRNDWELYKDSTLKSREALIQKHSRLAFTGLKLEKDSKFSGYQLKIGRLKIPPKTPSFLDS